MVSPPAPTNHVSDLLKRHAQLESQFGDGESGNWLSGWQCDNPWIDAIRAEVEKFKTTIDQDKYHYLSEDARTSDNLRAFHVAADANVPEGFLCGAGSSTVIFTFCAWLREQNVTEVHYIQPMFYSVHHALSLFGIKTRPINARHGYENGFKITLPKERSILLVTDPIWYAGYSLDDGVIASIAEWQRKTRSLVFVDGSFQYAQWNGQLREATSILCAQNTVRLICPTKALAAHGYRFAYATIPAQMLTKLKHIYSNIYGSASIESLAFGRALANLVIDREICNSLATHIATRHKSLRSKLAIDSDWQPNCGYFIYEKVLRPLPNSERLLRGPFFEQKRHTDHVRVNLLSPSIGLLD